jgi:hypothetical protein
LSSLWWEGSATGAIKHKPAISYDKRGRRRGRRGEFCRGRDKKSEGLRGSATIKAKARVWLMDRIHGRQTVTKWPRSRYKSQVKPISHVRMFSRASVILVIVLALSAAGGGTAYAAQDSLPGDALYLVKLSTEQVALLLPGDDVVKAGRALSFAERRMGEIEALVEEGRSQDLALAVEKYGYALNMAIARMERARNRGLDTGNVTARVAEATARHLLILDGVWDKAPDQAKAAIAHAREVSERGRQNALVALARNDSVRAVEMNLAAMLGRLNRVRVQTGFGAMETVEDALQQFEDMARFGQELSQIAEETGLNITEVAELVTEATSIHLQVLAELYEEVPEQAKEAVQRAMEQSFRGYEMIIGVLRESDVGEPEIPVIPEKTRQRMEDILGWPDAPKADVPTSGSPGGSCGCRH